VEIGLTALPNRANLAIPKPSLAYVNAIFHYLLGFHFFENIFEQPSHASLRRLELSSSAWCLGTRETKGGSAATMKDIAENEEVSGSDLEGR